VACEHAGLSGRGRSRVTCNGGGADSDRGPPFQLTLHVTAGHRSAGTSRRRSVLEASDLSVEQARFPLLFPRNVERDLVADENRRDLGEFLTGGLVKDIADAVADVYTPESQEQAPRPSKILSRNYCTRGVMHWR
jgi:hypothetical protein